MDDLKQYIREVPDFPKPGILFYDITTLLQNDHALRMTIDRFVWMFARHHVDKVVGIESRGFMFAPIVAYNLCAGFVPVRKPGKLPYETVGQSYDLEYGSDRVEMHSDAVSPGDKVLLVRHREGDRRAGDRGRRRGGRHGFCGRAEVSRRKGAPPAARDQVPDHLLGHWYI